ncbi:hypothetical protein FACS18942_07190 [Planctomycetales bacterium]|nr:hypothetical protein FACS18942_07190 [Planctomycetales bacterium]GHT37257.1 hypothetical protein FACS189427_09960 [Planctomycetales bacterium]
MSAENTPQEPAQAVPEEVIAAIPVDEDFDPALANLHKKVSVRELINAAPGLFFSLAVHGVIIILLALSYLPAVVNFRPDLTANLEDIEEIEDLDIFEEDAPVELNLDNVADTVPIETPMEAADTQMDFEQPKMEIATADLGSIMAPESLVSGMGSVTGDLSGRKNKGAAVAGGGGSEASERSVATGLQWIADHQLPNGAWSYTQMKNPDCRGKCKDSPIDKANKSMISATAMALLPMLGSGITHKEGKYKKEVKAGLDYITSNFQMTKDGIILAEKGAGPLMYHHGLTTIVVAEAAAMTRDKNLEKLAQGAVNYIAFAQDPVGGGWRYSPKQPGDTSGMGWNFMALKSAQMGYLNIPKKTIVGSKNFLDNVVGAKWKNYPCSIYGYCSGKKEKEGIERDIRGTTAIGLLGQMYMGWKPDNLALQEGTQFLAEKGPDRGNLYYCYYATQVMHHVGGTKWENWNKSMRDSLVNSQCKDKEKDKHAFGSWDTPGPGNLVGDSGGRLTQTAFAVMILEVYYRHLPLYRKNTTVDAFPLD